MSRFIYEYTKSVLERVSFDVKLFCKELKKAISNLLPYELEELQEWLIIFIQKRPELKHSLLIIKKQ